MATVSERLAFLITADATSAIKAFENTGKAADRELGKAEAKIDKLGANMTRFGAGALAAAGVAGGALFSFADAAGDAAEATSKVNVIFGDAADTIRKFGQEAARSTGLSETAALNAASTFATLGKAAGLAGEELADFSTEQVSLAADLASFNNTSPEQAIEAIGAALRGEAEPIRAYGVLLNDATIKARAFELGIYDGTGALDQQAKVIATQAEIFAQTSDAQGDFARTSDGLANQQKILAAELENVKIAIGEGVLPLMTDLVSGVGGVVGAFNNLNPAVQSGVGSFAAYGTAALGVVGSLSLVGGQAIKARDRFTDLGDDGSRSLNKLGKATAAAGAGIAALGVIAAVDAAFTSANRTFEKTEAAVNDLLVAALDATSSNADILSEIGRAAQESESLFERASDFLGFYDDARIELGGYSVEIDGVVESLDRLAAKDPDAASRAIVALREAAEEMIALGGADGILGARLLGQVDEFESQMTSAAAATAALGAKADEGAEPIANLGEEAEKTAAYVQTLEEKYSGLLRAFDEAETLLDVTDQFDDLRSKATEAYDAAAEGSADAEQAQRDLQREIIDTKRQVVEYATQVGGIPDEAVTEILALLDQGKIDEAEAKIEQFTRNRQLVVDVITRGGGVDNFDFRDDNSVNKPDRAAAYGGPVRAGENVLVGETGRELFVPATDGFVYPAAKFRDAPAGSSSSVVNNWNITTQAGRPLAEEINELMVLQGALAR